MAGNSSIYDRVLIKLSGEALMGNQEFGISAEFLMEISREIKSAQELGVQISIVIGGGNFLRGGTLEAAGMTRVAGDHMGMLATVMNSLALQDSLRKVGVKTKMYSSIELPGVSQVFQYDRAIKSLESGCVVIIAGGTGNPLFTTDTAACLRAIEVDADVVIKATKVDGIYNKDPKIHSDAIKYDTLTYDEVLQNKLAVMDLTAIVMCQEHSLFLRVIDMTTPGNLQAVMMSHNIGTLVGN